MFVEPTFYVGNVPVYGDAVLAPMAGYSDVPYRALCRAFGSAMHYTEFVPVEGLVGKKRDNRFWRRLDRKPDEHPIIFQIFGNDAVKILDAAMRIQELAPDIIDINMGCSTRRVSGRGAGVGMMPRPALVAETFQLLSSNLRIPVTGKIRLGWDDEQRNFAEIARIMEDNGAALIAMHARTKTQKYGGRADWDSIAYLRSVVSIPVIGNGDVRTPEDIQALKDHTGCDAVMIGRAAIGNPWIFARRNKEDISRGEILDGVRLHAREMVDYYGQPHGLVLFRKHLKRYLSQFPDAGAFLPQLLQCTELPDFYQTLDLLEEPLQETF